MADTEWPGCLAVGESSWDLAVLEQAGSSCKVFGNFRLFLPFSWLFDFYLIAEKYFVIIAALVL